MKTITLSALLILTSLIVLGGVKLTDRDIYYCESRDLVVQCNRISSTDKTCYSDSGNKVCSEGWQRIVNDIQINNPSVQKAKQWTCNNIECIEVK